MPEEQQPELNRPPQRRSSGRGRGYRGGHGRGRGRVPRQTTGPAADEIAASAPRHELPETRSVEQDGSAIARAANDVRRIVESLEGALEQMEEVLELVELAEQQKIGDEQEIESLRRALRRIQPPRGERDRREEAGA